MRKLQNNLPIRTAAWVLFLAAVCAALFFGQKLLFAYCYTWSGDWSTTAAFDRLLTDRTYQVWDYLEYQAELEQGGLDYVDREQTETLFSATREALSPQNTNFRYQMLQKDGSSVLDSNLEDLETPLVEQVTGIYYGVFSIANGTVGFVQKDSIGTEFYAAAQESGTAAENAGGAGT